MISRSCCWVNDEDVRATKKSVTMSPTRQRILRCTLETILSRISSTQATLYNLPLIGRHLLSTSISFSFEVLGSFLTSPTEIKHKSF
uniref:Uncharacterized protein n=1 Tax=Arundo donax TaxID=35708 RepID=A0A0A9CMI9_ARUDO